MTQQIQNKPVPIAIVGTGGFARSHHQVIQTLEKEGECKLVATCDINPDLLREAGEKFQFADRGVLVFPDADSMLEKCRDSLDAVTLPVPVHIHELMHRKFVSRGLSVYLEKPPVLYGEALDRMIEDEKMAPNRTTVGFNYISQPERIKIKERILKGEFGRIKEIRLRGVWLRPDAYYRRNAYAGHLTVGDQPVLDCCLTNAMSHHVVNALHWAGATLHSFSGVDRVEAKLYRAHQIESTDSVLVKAILDQGIVLKAALSHASTDENFMYEEVYCEKAVICYRRDKKGKAKSWFEIRHTDGCTESAIETKDDKIRNMEHFLRTVRDHTILPTITLSDSRSFVCLAGLVFASAGKIETVCDSQAVEKEGHTFKSFPAWKALTEAFFESGFSSFQEPPEEIKDLPKEGLAGVISRIRLND